MGARQNLHTSGWIHAYFSALPQADTATKRSDRLRGSDTAGFDVCRIAKATQLAVPRGVTLSLAETVHIGNLECFFKRCIIVAGIVRHDHQRLMRKCLDEITSAQ